MPEKGWEVEFTKSALKSLRRLPKSQSQRILNGLKDLQETENPLLHKDVRALEGKLKSFFRVRIGEYRVIFELDGEEKRIGILAISSRGRAY